MKKATGTSLEAAFGLEKLDAFVVYEGAEATGWTLHKSKKTMVQEGQNEMGTKDSGSTAQQRPSL